MNSHSVQDQQDNEKLASYYVEKAKNDVPPLGIEPRPFRRCASTTKHCDDVSHAGLYAEVNEAGSLLTTRPEELRMISVACQLLDRQLWSHNVL